MNRVQNAVRPGGKDSSATLYLLHKILSERRNLELTAFTVDEGIEGYRSTGLEKAMERP